MLLSLLVKIKCGKLEVLRDSLLFTPGMAIKQRELESIYKCPSSIVPPRAQFQGVTYTIFKTPHGAGPVVLWWVLLVQPLFLSLTHSPCLQLDFFWGKEIS
jgi:hypothetical protein